MKSHDKDMLYNNIILIFSTVHYWAFRQGARVLAVLACSAACHMSASIMLHHAWSPIIFHLTPWQKPLLVHAQQQYSLDFLHSSLLSIPPRCKGTGCIILCYVPYECIYHAPSSCMESNHFPPFAHDKSHSLQQYSLDFLHSSLLIIPPRCKGTGCIILCCVSHVCI
jgi:hypothetical protein